MYQTKAIVLLLILFVFFFMSMCRAQVGSTKEKVYGLLAILSVVLILGVTLL